MSDSTAHYPNLAAPPSIVRGISNAVAQGAGAHGIYFAIAFTYLGAYVAVAPRRDARLFAEIALNGFMVLAIALGAALFSAIVFHFIHMARVSKPESPIRDLMRRLGEHLRDRPRLAAGLPMLLALVPFMTAYAGIKPLIPAMAGGFPWDAAFDTWDRVLHFDVLPWEWLHPLLGQPFITFLVNLVYNGWFFVNWMTLTAFAFTARPGLDRTRYFLSFMLVWSIGGSLIAMLFSSAGPAFYSRIGLAPDPYSDLMAYLRQVNEFLPIWAVSVQDTLWTGFGGINPFDGISAMPSMHNAAALLAALAGARFGKTVQRLLWLHCALIFIGSVHLGWHYAVDAYVAWGLTLLAWWASEPLARWWHRRPAMLEPASELRA